MKITIRKKIIFLFVLLLVSSALYYLWSVTDRKEQDYETGGKTAYVFNEELTGSISREIDEIFYSFGIRESWIRDKKDGSGSLWFHKEVIIPKDIVSSEIILELTGHLRKYNLHDKVYEEPRTRNIAFEIFDMKDSVLKKVSGISLIYSDSVRRDNKYVSLILDNLQNYPLEGAVKILSSTEKYSVVLPLSNEKSDYQSAVYEHNKDYVLKFTIGNEEDLTADFRSDMPEKVWKSRIKTISLAYLRTGGVILSGSTERSEHAFISDIAEEFRKNDMKVYRDTMFVFFSSAEKGEAKITALISDIKSRSGSREFLFYIADLSPDEFAIYDKEIYTLKKKGVRFYNFKNTVRKIDPRVPGTEAENIIP